MSDARSKRDADVRLRAGQGTSYAVLAREYDVTRQRIWQIARGEERRVSSLRIERGGQDEVWLHPPDRPIVGALKWMMQEIGNIDPVYAAKAQHWIRTIEVAIKVIEQECET